jgi:hypothetical protein
VDINCQGLLYKLKRKWSKELTWPKCHFSSLFHAGVVGHSKMVLAGGCSCLFDAVDEVALS